MWARKRIDITWSDLLFGVWRTCFPPDRTRTAKGVESPWPNPAHTLACLSVRSGLDLLLAAMALPRDSEVLVSAITIPDMIRIIEHHGLIPVPVDLDPQRMSPTPDAWQAAVTRATRAIVIAHLFGGLADVEPLLEMARRHNLLVIEDCAQAFGGTGYQGHPDADASMFSFGMIKARTALGGAVLRIRDSGLLRRMRAMQAAYPVESRWRYLKRLAKSAGFKALGYGPLCSLFVYVCRTIGWDYDRWVNGAARGFPGDGLFAQLRRQPSASLLAVLHRRLRNHDPCRAERHAAKGKALASALRESVTCPGATVVPHTYWVFPVLVEEPKRLIERLARAGYDATQGQSLCVVHAPKDRPRQSPLVAEGILAKAVFLPFYPELPHRESQRMAEVVMGSAVDS